MDAWFLLQVYCGVYLPSLKPVHVTAAATATHLLNDLIAYDLLLFVHNKRCRRKLNHIVELCRSLAVLEVQLDSSPSLQQLSGDMHSPFDPHIFVRSSNVSLGL